jgi:hypothetical protein
MDAANATAVAYALSERDDENAFVRDPDRLRAALEAAARDCVGFRASLDPTGRWLLADIGRTSIYTVALVLDAQPQGLTMANLSAASQFATVSRGRVCDFVERALAAGEFSLKPGPDAWTRRRLTISPTFSDRMRRRCGIDARAVGLLDPALAGAESWLDDEALFRRFLYWIGYFGTQGSLSKQGPSPMKLFLHSGGGGRLLMALLAAQPANRTRLLETAPISRSALGRDCSISRPHINRLLATAEANDLIAFEAENRIRISAALSDAFEETLIVALAVTRAALKAAARV